MKTFTELTEAIGSYGTNKSLKYPVVDKTEHARKLGYKGKEPVEVSRGKVVSHGNVSWLDFTDSLNT